MSERKKPKTTEYAQGWDDHVAAASALSVALTKADTEIQQLREQQQVLVDALNDVLAMDDGPRSSTFSDIFTNVRSALAKVKEWE